MFTGLPGGSPGSGARAGCGGLIVISVVSLIAALLLLKLLLYATQSL